MTAAPTYTPSRRSPAAAVVIGAVALAAIGAGAVFYQSRTPVVEPATSTPPPPAVAAPPPAVAPPPAQPAVPPPSRPSVEEARPADSKPAAPASGSTSRRAGARAETEAVPAAAAAELAQAEEALARGNAAEAIRIAQHSLYAGKSTRAFAIVVKARCRQGDLGGARAALAQVGATQRGPVLRDCAAHGMDLR